MNNNKFKNWMYGIGVVVVLGGLFAWPIINDDSKALVKAWDEVDVDCLSGGHQVAQLHIHPQIRITVDGSPESIPDDMGSVRACTMAEIHTHDSSGTLHVESTLSSKEFNLGQFLVVYGEPLEREGYNLEVRVNGEASEASADLVFEDRQVIELIYTSE